MYIHTYILLSLLLLPSMPEKRMRRRSMQSTAASCMGCPEPSSSFPSQRPCPVLLTSLQGPHFPSRFTAPNCSAVLCLLKKMLLRDSKKKEVDKQEGFNPAFASPGWRGFTRYSLRHWRFNHHCDATANSSRQQSRQE